MPLSTNKIEWSADDDNDDCSESSEFSLVDYCDIEQSLNNSAVDYTDNWEQASKCSSFSKWLDKDVSSQFDCCPMLSNHFQTVPKCNFFSNV